MYLELQRKLASITIQRNYRGRLDRQLYRMKAHKYWYYNKYLPQHLNPDPEKKSRSRRKY